MINKKISGSLKTAHKRQLMIERKRDIKPKIEREREIERERKKEREGERERGHIFAITLMVTKESESNCFGLAEEAAARVSILYIPKFWQNKRKAYQTCY